MRGFTTLAIRRFRHQSSPPAIDDNGDCARIDIPVDPEILASLEQLSEFRRAYEPDGMTPEEFDSFGATRKTLRQFLGADEELDQIVRNVIMPAP